MAERLDVPAKDGPIRWYGVRVAASDEEPASVTANRGGPITVLIHLTWKQNILANAAMRANAPRESRRRC